MRPWDEDWTEEMQEASEPIPSDVAQLFLNRLWRWWHGASDDWPSMNVALDELVSTETREQFYKRQNARLNKRPRRGRPGVT